MFEIQGGTRNRTRDLPKKGSAFVTSSDRWTRRWGGWVPYGIEGTAKAGLVESAEVVRVTHAARCSQAILTASSGYHSGSLWEPYFGLVTRIV